MNKLIFVIIFFVFLTNVEAQQKPHYTQYILNNYILNPALTGIENYTDIKISARDQWSGFSGAPRTLYLTAHGPIGKKDFKSTATSFDVPGENPRGTNYWENYRASDPHHGIGFNMVSDKTGNFNRFSMGISYAYHLGINANTNLAGGFSAGVNTTSLNADGKAYFGSNPSDPAVGGVLAGELRKIKPDISVGLWLYGADYFIGASAQQVVPQKLSFVNDATFKPQGKLIPHLFLTAGYRFLLTEDINALPSVMVKYINGAFKNNYQAELNLKLQYHDLLWLGASVRQFDGFAAMLGVNVGNVFNVGYSYDFTQTSLRTYSRGTHEIMVGFMIGNNYGDSCPRNVW